jgi:hypothetical protein
MKLVRKAIERECSAKKRYPSPHVRLKFDEISMQKKKYMIDTLDMMSTANT